MFTTADQLFLPSGLNDEAQATHNNFSEYLKIITAMISQARCDLTPENQDTIVTANSPFEWLPKQPPQSNGKYSKGVLLIHGLFASPFYTMDLGRFFQQRGFLVRSILLPGHGTRPGDLLNVKYHAWEQITQFSVEQMFKVANDVYLCGISLGGTLAVQQAIRYPDIKALVLFAIALKPYYWWANFVKWHTWGSWLHSRLVWLNKFPSTSYVRYDSWPLNGAAQALKLMAKVHGQTHALSLNQPLCITATMDDEIVSAKKIINFFTTQTHPASRMQLFTNEIFNLTDPRISFYKSACPEQKILDLSHQCLTISPDNPYLGAKGDYKDFLHYRNRPDSMKDEIYQGAITPRNLRQYIIQRITYNHYFQDTLDFIADFID